MRDLAALNLYGRTTRRTARAATLGTALLTIAACSADNTGPTGKVTLDASAVSASASRLEAVVQQPVISAMLSQGSTASLPSLDRSAGHLPRLSANAARLAAAPRLLTRATLGGSATPATPAPRVMASTMAALIPDSLLGKTLVPDGQGKFTVSASATGAPSTGVRFVIRAPGTTTNLGYADLSENMSGTTSTLSLDVSTTTGALLMHDVEATTVSGSDETDAFTGYATNGTDRVDYTVNIQTANSRTIATTTLTAPAMTLAVADTSVIDGFTASDVDVSHMTIGSTVIRLTTPTVPDTSSSGSYMPGDTSKVTVNGSAFATVVIGDVGVPTITDPNGAPLSADDRNALISVEMIMLSAEGMVLAPVSVVFWLILATTGF